MDSVMALKLVNGDEVLAKVEILADGFYAKKPALLGMVPDGNGRPSLGLADYLPMSDDKGVRIAKTSVLFVWTPKAELINAYNSMFGSGLVVPTPANSPFTIRG